MLLNLSNHLSDQWGKAQRQNAIAQYGKIEDLPFPTIAPQNSSEEIQKLAINYCQRIVALQPQAVHLMGEMTFTFTLVRLLQKQRISCIASTSQRKVVAEENGQKTVLFEFEQFREYPKA
ncbi:CRISPR-associated protein [Aureispira sp. CCB-E]|uniref:CRISPR-associated protein n=1 Tax=Aureispira sp. CCB-E TaxID=3051121 RepID=UPI0028687EE7|nr:CRISPR-associated protein [Aureispira sp. CCB-E]WMX17566.1 CRISPR-associated protein [Aureispira sp. CCB-E]